MTLPVRSDRGLPGNDGNDQGAGRSAHQSGGEPLTRLAEPGLASFEPAYADELAVLLRWAFEEIQREEGQSVYFRLSTPADRPAAAKDRRGLGRGDRRRRLLAA